jgi:hypothetical protein
MRFPSWTNVMMLGFEAQQAISLRMMRIAWGGALAEAEAARIISEKIGAADAAALAVMRGEPVDKIVRGYRCKVRANI